MAKALEMSFSNKKTPVAKESTADSSVESISSTSSDNDSDTDSRLEKALALYKTDKFKAFELFQQCGENNPGARYHLGVYYLNGLGGVKKNVEVAKRHFKFAISCEYLPAYFQMGYLLTQEKNIPQAVEYFRIGARKGNVDCMWALGRFYYTGSKGVIEKSIDQAKYWLQRAADNNHKRAQKDLVNIDR